MSCRVEDEANLEEVEVVVMVVAQVEVLVVTLLVVPRAWWTPGPGVLHAR